MSYVYTTTYTTYYPTASCPWPEGHPPDQGASQSSSSVVHAYSSSSASNGPPPQSAQNGTCYCPTPQGLVNHTSGGAGEAPSGAVAVGIDIDAARRGFYGRTEQPNLIECPCTSPDVVTVLPPGQPYQAPASSSSRSGLVENSYSGGAG